MPLRLPPPPVGVRGLDYPLALAVARLRCCPSSLYTFRVLTAWLGIATGATREVSPTLSSSTPGVSTGALHSGSLLCLPISPRGVTVPKRSYQRAGGRSTWRAGPADVLRPGAARGDAGLENIRRTFYPHPMPTHLPSSLEALPPRAPPVLAPPRPALVLGTGVGFARGRVHELCGPARRTLALMLAGRLGGDVLWIAPDAAARALNPAGMAGFCAPERLILAAATPDREVLWCVEEALRSGAVAVVVAELAAPPGLTPMRRLQLAAEASGSTATGFLLTPEAGGAPGAESRWHIAPAHAEGQSRWLLERRRGRGGAPPATWQMQLNTGGALELD